MAQALLDSIVKTEPNRTNPHYSSAQHIAWAKALKARAGWRCQECGKGCELYAMREFFPPRFALQRRPNIYSAAVHRACVHWFFGFRRDQKGGWNETLENCRSCALRDQLVYLRGGFSRRSGPKADDEETPSPPPSRLPSSPRYKRKRRRQDLGVSPRRSIARSPPLAAFFCGWRASAITSENVAKLRIAEHPHRRARECVAARRASDVRADGGLSGVSTARSVAISFACDR
jgi:hypothetical protein